MSWKGRPVSVLFGLLALSTPLFAQQQPTPEQMERARSLMAPGPEHTVLAGMAGSWDQQVRYWSEPGAEPVTFPSKAEARMILGGRFLEMRSDMEFMGEHWEALSLLGFDRRRGMFTIVGLDTAGTYWVTAEGAASGTAGEIVLAGTDRDPLLGHVQEYEFRFRIEGRDRFVMEIVFLDAAHTRGGGPFRMMEVTSTRRGG